MALPDHPCQTTRQHSNPGDRWRVGSGHSGFSGARAGVTCPLQHLDPGRHIRIVRRADAGNTRMAAVQRSQHPTGQRQAVKHRYCSVSSRRKICPIPAAQAVSARAQYTLVDRILCEQSRGHPLIGRLLAGGYTVAHTFPSIEDEGGETMAQTALIAASRLKEASTAGYPSAPLLSSHSPTGHSSVHEEVASLPGGL